MTQDSLGSGDVPAVAAAAAERVADLAFAVSHDAGQGAAVGCCGEGGEV